MPLDRNDYEDAVRRFGPSLLKTLRFLTKGRRQDAEDLLQRTFECAWAKRDVYVGGSPNEVQAWMRGIARNEYLMYLRRNGQVLRLQQAYLSEIEGAEPLGAAEPTLSHKPLRDCVAGLATADRAIVSSYYAWAESMETPSPPKLDQLPKSDREIAETMAAPPGKSWTENQVCKRRRLALRQLRECLKRKERQAETSRKVIQFRRAPRGSGPALNQAPELDELLDMLSSNDDTIVAQALERAEQTHNTGADGHDIGRLLADIMTIESWLLAPLWQRAEQEAEAIDEPLPPHLLATLLGVPDHHQGVIDAAANAWHEAIVHGEQAGHDLPADVEARLMAVGNTKPWYQSPWLQMAAGLLAFVGLGLWLGPLGVPGSGSTTPLVFRGDVTPEPGSKSTLRITPQLIILDPTTEETRQAAIEEVAPGQFKSEAAADMAVQLRLRPTRRFEAPITVNVQLLGGDSDRVPEPVEGGKWRIGLDSSDADVAAGRPLRLSQLAVLGLGPGDYLLYQMTLGDEDIFLRVNITSPSGVRP